MFSQYVEKAMHKATYESIDDGTYWGRIPGFTGVWANEATLEECREELRSVLEEWLVLKLWLNDDDLPVIGRMSLTPTKKQLRTLGSNISPRPAKAS